MCVSHLSQVVLTCFMSHPICHLKITLRSPYPHKFELSLTIGLHLLCATLCFTTCVSCGCLCSFLFNLTLVTVLMLVPHACVQALCMWEGAPVTHTSSTSHRRWAWNLQRKSRKETRKETYYEGRRALPTSVRKGHLGLSLQEGHNRQT